MTINGIDPILIAMPPGGEDRAREFYSHLLGLREIENPLGLRARGGCWFRAPSIELQPGGEEDFKPARKAHVAFLVEVLSILQAKLVNAGAPVIPDDALAGVHRFYSEDPFGNRLEFILDREGFSKQAPDME